jgi:S1-C subfamily serine protease
MQPAPVIGGDKSRFGFIINKEGTFTNDHVVRDAETIKVVVQ